MKQEVDALCLQALKPLDRVRAWGLVGIGAPLSELLRHRGKRTGALMLLGVALAIGLTLWTPWSLMLWGPLLLGVPHVAADLRYLVLGRGAHGRSEVQLLVLPLVLISGLLESPLWAAVATAVAAIAARGPLVRKAAVLVLCGIFVSCILAEPRIMKIAFTHGHNLIAIAVVGWMAHERCALRWMWPSLAMFVAGAALLLSGGLDRIADHGLARALNDPFFGQTAAALSPSGSAATTLHWVLFFLFAQSVHYGVWLRLVPEYARPRPGIRGFESSYRALCMDSSRWLTLVALVATMALLGWAAADAWTARNGYLRLAFFHGPLELAMFAWLFVRGEALCQPQNTRKQLA